MVWQGVALFFILIIEGSKKLFFFYYYYLYALPTFENVSRKIIKIVLYFISYILSPHFLYFIIFSAFLHNFCPIFLCLFTTFIPLIFLKDVCFNGSGSTVSQCARRNIPISIKFLTPLQGKINFLFISFYFYNQSFFSCVRLCLQLSATANAPMICGQCAKRGPLTSTDVPFFEKSSNKIISSLKTISLNPYFTNNFIFREISLPKILFIMQKNGDSISIALQYCKK